MGDGGDAVVRGGEGEIYADDGGGSGALAGGGEPGGERGRSRLARGRLGERGGRALDRGELEGAARRDDDRAQPVGARRGRSEEHTSELQSLMRISYAVFCLKKKKHKRRKAKRRNGRQKESQKH